MNPINYNTNDEKIALYIQRCYRGNIRRNNEIERISQVHFNTFEKEEARGMAKKAIRDANKPYIPQKCSRDCARKIMVAAQQVKLSSKAKHQAATPNVAPIIDTFLMGRENLDKSGTNYRPAALFDTDVKNGDGNVICFGINLIDRRCERDRTVGLVFDRDSILNTDNFNRNPAIFFKQKDFGFSTKYIHQIPIGKQDTIRYSHTDYEPLRNGNDNCIDLQIYEPFQNRMTHFSEVPKYSFISYNTSAMDKILTLNFFRFIDTLKDTHRQLDEWKIKQIYDYIDTLNEVQLVQFLTEIGEQMSCTCEFNFFGAYKIDLNALTDIEIYNGKLTMFDLFEYPQQYRSGVNRLNINLKQLVEQLNAGKTEAISILAEHAPEFFQSQRFVEHLASQIQDKTVLEPFLNQTNNLNS